MRRRCLSANETLTTNDDSTRGVFTTQQFADELSSPDSIFTEFLEETMTIRILLLFLKDKLLPVRQILRLIGGPSDKIHIAFDCARKMPVHSRICQDDGQLGRRRFCTGQLGRRCFCAGSLGRLGRRRFCAGRLAGRHGIPVPFGDPTGASGPKLLSCPLDPGRRRRIDQSNRGSLVRDRSLTILDGSFMILSSIWVLSGLLHAWRPAP